jgi:hypothetical protein
MMKDSTMVHDSTMNTMKDSVATVVPDSTAKP